MSFCLTFLKQTAVRPPFYIGFLWTKVGTSKSLSPRRSMLLVMGQQKI